MDYNYLLDDEEDDDLTPYTSVSNGPVPDPFEDAMADRSPAGLEHHGLDSSGLFVPGKALPGKKFEKAFIPTQEQKQRAAELLKQDPKAPGVYQAGHLGEGDMGSFDSPAKPTFPNPDYVASLIPKLNSVESEPILPPKQPLPPPLAVKEAIKRKFSAPPAESDLSAEDLSRFRGAMIPSNLMQNWGEAWAQAAQGPQKPEINHKLYDHMNSQSGALLDSLDKQRTSDNARKSVMAQIAAKFGLADVNNAAAMDRAKITAAGKDKSMGYKEEANNRANTTSANSLFKNPAIQNEEVKLGTVSNAKELISAIRSGQLQGSKNIRQQLASIISKIDLGTNGSAHDRQEMGVSTLYGLIQDFYGYLAGKPTDTITKKYIDQIHTETNALGERAKHNYKQLTDAVLEQADGEVKKKGQARQRSFLKSTEDAQSSGSYPKEVRSKDKKAIVSNAEEEAKANAKGFY